LVSWSSKSLSGVETIRQSNFEEIKVKKGSKRQVYAIVVKKEGFAYVKRGIAD
jgi:hypothetical protein